MVFHPFFWETAAVVHIIFDLKKKVIFGLGLIKTNNTYQFDRIHELNERGKFRHIF